MPVSSATTNCGIDWVSLYNKLESFETIQTILTQDCVSCGKIMSLRSIQDIIRSGKDASVMLRAINDLAVAVQRTESRKNDLLEQVLQKKFGDNFVVTHKPLNDCKASPYAKSLGGHYSVDWTTGLDYWTGTLDCHIFGFHTFYGWIYGILLVSTLRAPAAHL